MNLCLYYEEDFLLLYGNKIWSSARVPSCLLWEYLLDLNEKILVKNVCSTRMLWDGHRIFKRRRSWGFAEKFELILLYLEEYFYDIQKPHFQFRQLLDNRKEFVIFFEITFWLFFSLSLRESKRLSDPHWIYIRRHVRILSSPNRIDLNFSPKITSIRSAL